MQSREDRNTVVLVILIQVKETRDDASLNERTATLLMYISTFQEKKEWSVRCNSTISIFNGLLNCLRLLFTGAT
jgi:hypothetical protein